MARITGNLSHPECGCPCHFGPGTGVDNCHCGYDGQDERKRDVYVGTAHPPVELKIKQGEAVTEFRVYGTVHKAGPELDALIAEKVMGWKSENHSRTLHDPQAGPSWCGPDGAPRQRGDWSPSTSLADAWEMEEEIARRRMMIAYTDALKRECMASENDVPMTFDLVHADPVLRCRAALKAMLRMENLKA